MRRVLISVLPVSLVLAAVATFAPAAGALPSTLDLVGHGWGHGRGMGQYGAFGYALSGSNYQQILGHFYGGTVLTTTPVKTVYVQLDELDGAGTVTVRAKVGTQLNCGAKVIASPTDAVKSCPNGILTAHSGGDLVVNGPWPGGAATREFAGGIEARPTDHVVWNVAGLEQYVEGVVPREMPASWSAEALKAQAVAARSYVVSWGAALSSNPICDNSACQNYGGDPAQYEPGADSTQSNAAVIATAAKVLECGTDAACGPSTKVAFAEYSSSSGGYTAGGAFPAVVDTGDGNPGAGNPNHSWSTQIPTSDVEAAYPSLGTLRSITVTGRNGLGELGGRVTQMVLTGTSGRITITGDQFASAMGLNSNWFAITNAGAPPGSDSGYWVVGSNGGVYPFGSAPQDGSMVGHQLNSPVVGMTPTFNGGGYWLVAGDGGIFSFGNAHFYGSTGRYRLNKPVVGMASTADSRGYWLVASDGGIFSFGDARFHGSTGNITLTRPVVGMARTKDGGGYWLVASDGGIFAYGDAHFYGSAGKFRLAQPIVGMVPTSDGRGYWLVGRDGGIFSFGDARFVGSLPGEGIQDTIAAVTPTPDNRGYLMVSTGGTVYTFGDASYLGDPASTIPGWSGGAIAVSARA